MAVLQTYQSQGLQRVRREHDAVLEIFQMHLRRPRLVHDQDLSDVIPEARDLPTHAYLGHLLLAVRELDFFDALLDVHRPFGEGVLFSRTNSFFGLLHGVRGLVGLGRRALDVVLREVGGRIRYFTS